MARIVVLSAGGTIASRNGARGSVATDSAAQLLGNASHYPAAVDVEAVSVLSLNSFNATMADILTLSRAVDTQLARHDVDGIVVTHGTDTLEESAFLVDLVHDDPRPIVFTGAQHSADHPSPDGPANLADAITVASSPTAAGLGTLVVFAGKILPARGVYKGHTIDLDPFRSRTTGAIGTVSRGAVEFGARPGRGPVIAAPSDGFALIDVPMILTYPGSGAHAFVAAVDAGAQGIVIVGTGAGNPNASLIHAIREATSAGVVVALSTRVSAGPVIALYGGGGGYDAVHAGAIGTGCLPASQARILLSALLDQCDPAQAATRFADFCAENAHR